MSNTQVFAGIDWLTTTHNYGGTADFRTPAERVMKMVRSRGLFHVIEPTNGVHAYRYGWLDNLTGAQCYYGPAERRNVMFVLPGQVWRSQQVPAVDLFNNLMFWGWRPSRVDVSVDIHGDDAARGFAQLEAYYSVRRGGSKKIGYTHSRKGWMITVGSRTSNRYVRIYDKGLEQGSGPGTWMRIETETKGKIAHSLAGKDYRWVVTDGAAFARTVVQPASKELDAILARVSSGMDYTRHQRPVKSAGVKWYEDSVIPAITKLRGQNAELYMEVRELFVQAGLFGLE